MMKSKLFESKKPDTLSSASLPFISPAWQQHASLLNHLCQFSQNIILVTAPIGGGKTSFAQYYMELVTPGIRKEKLSISKPDTIESFIAKIGQSFGVEFIEGEPWYQSIQSTIDAQDVICTLLIDDAHLLGMEHLKALLELAYREQERSLRIVLFSEPSLELRLFSPDFNSLVQGKIYTIELESWSLSETQQFIMQVAPNAISQDQINKIFEQTQGLPGLVAQEVKQFSEQMKSEGVKMVKQKRRRLHPISLGILVGVVAGGSYLMLNNNLEEENPTPPTNSAQLSQNLNEQDLASNVDKVQFHFDKVDKSDITEADSQMITENNTTTLPAQMEPLPQETVSTQSLPQTQQQKLAQIQTQAEVQPQVQAESQEHQTELPAQTTVSEKPAEPVKTAITSNKASEKLAKLSGHEKQLLAMGKEHYTIQLLGASKEENVKKFILQHALQNKAHQFRTKRAGRDWYVVVYGDFKSKDDAKAALKDIPDSLKRAHLQPWVRDMAGVHSDIEKTKG